MQYRNELVQEIVRVIAPEDALTRFDYAYMNGIAEGDEAFKQEILAVFQQEVPDELEALKGYLQEGNWKAAAAGVHKLRSRIRILGLHRLKALSDEAEPMLKSETDVVTAQHLVRQCIGSLEVCLLRISEETRQQA